MYFKKCILFTLLLAAITTLGEATEELDTALPGTGPEEVNEDALDRVSKQGSCVTNLCFALDGSSSISEDEYRRQRFLTWQVVKVIPASADIGLAAVQYGVASIAISSLTSDRADFESKVRSSVQDGAEGTFLVAGINYCFSELFELNKDMTTCSNNKIIVMGDGNGNIGADPAERARLFEDEGGEVYTVAFGRANFTSLTAIAGDSSKVFVRSAGIKELAKEILSSIGLLSGSS